MQTRLLLQDILHKQLARQGTRNNGVVYQRLPFNPTHMPMVLSMEPTILSTKPSVETLCVYSFNIFTLGTMEQLSFIISTIVFINFLFSHHVRLIEMRVLNSLDFLNIDF